MPPRPYAPRTPSRTALAAAAALVAVFALACSSDSNAGFVGAPAILVAAAGDGTNSTVATEIGPFVVKVTDTAGTPVTNVPVTFTSSAGLTITPTSGTTNEDGTVFTAGTFGDVAGNYTVTARVAGISTPLVFHATAFADVPSVFAATGGDNQAGLAGSVLPDFLQVTVSDKYGNGISGVSVAWSAAGGTLTAAQAHTDANGLATATYTLPAIRGSSQVMVAATVGSTPMTVTFTETGN
jgi:adhesin/invasin